MFQSKSFKNGNAFLVIAVLVMILLFISSSQTYEQQTTVPLFEKILKAKPFENFLRTVSFQYADSEVSIAKLGYFKFVEFFVRKGAHFTTYFILGGSFFLGLYPKYKNRGVTLLVSWLAASGYAGLDEFHQMLTGGRTPLFQDVALDSAGALTAGMICLLFLLFKKKRR